MVREIGKGIKRAMSAATSEPRAPAIETWASEPWTSDSCSHCFPAPRAYNFPPSNGPLAQSAEQEAHNFLVTGSSPVGPIIDRIAGIAVFGSLEGFWRLVSTGGPGLEIGPFWQDLKTLSQMAGGTSPLV